MKDKRLKSSARLIIIGGSELVVDLAKLVQKKGYAVMVITSPRQVGEIMSNGIVFKEAIRALALDCHIVEKIDSPEVRDLVGNMNHSIALSLGAAWIFSEHTIFEVFGNRLFNLHPGALPINRGGGGFSWQILMGSRVGHGVCHRVNSGVDTGEVIFHHEFLFPPECFSPADYWLAYKSEMLIVLDANIDRLFSSIGGVVASVQPEYLSTYWPRINTEQQAWIDWTLDLANLVRLICAFDEPYSGAKTRWIETDVCLKKVQGDYSEMYAHPFQFGMVYRNNGRWLSIAANGGTLIVERILDASGQNLLKKIKVGDRLHTEISYLEQRNTRIFYSPSGMVYKK
jgi:methionyl-tRNA formyltransferase